MTVHVAPSRLEAGDFVVGIAPPTVTTAAGDTQEGTWTINGLVAEARTSNNEEVTSIRALASGTPIQSVTRSTERNQPRWIITPTALGRVIDPAAHETTGWREAVARGVANRTGLYQQFICHPMSGLARAKGTWNVEQWRPTVGLGNTLGALCNPQ